MNMDGNNNNDNGDGNDDAGVPASEVLERLSDSMFARARPEIRRLREIGEEAYAAELARFLDEESKRREAPYEVEVPSLTSVERRTLQSRLTELELSPAEEKRARFAKYPVFKDESREMIRTSNLFEAIPFRLEGPFDRNGVVGSYCVYHHDEKVDWGVLEGWEIPSTLRPIDEGMVHIVKSDDSGHLKGYLGFFPGEEKGEGEIEDGEEGHGSEEEMINEEFHSNDDRSNDEEEVEDQSGGSEDDESANEEFRANDDGSNDEEDSEEGDFDSDDDSSDDDSIDHEGGEDGPQCDDFFYFEEEHFVPDETYKENSWYISSEDGHCGFGLISHPANDSDLRLVHNGAAEGDSVTLFRAAETMAFARGEEQQFVSLDDPRNYGTECGSHYDYYTGMLPRENCSHQARVVDTMTAYRGPWTWVSKLCPPEMVIPDGVAQLIAEYIIQTPPPFLLVNKGDLVLLARYNETFPHPDLPGIATISLPREHIVLARPVFR